MTPGAVDDYVIRLERALRHRGCTDPRIVAEAREHLVDAVENGRARGLSIDDAEREAFERFGAPEIVAAQAAEERDLMKTGFAAVLDRVWDRKWWILAPTVLTAVLTSVLSYYFLPTRYRSESTVQVMSAAVPAEGLRVVATPSQSRARFEQLTRRILSRTRLERIISDYGLYQADRERVPIEDIVDQMRNDIRLDLLAPDVSADNDLGRFSVAFTASDPTTAMRVTERLASLFIMENLQEKEARAGQTKFIEAQTADVRRRIMDYEKKLATLRAQNDGRPLSQADLLPYEVLQETYRTLLVKDEDARIALNLERRQIGEQFKVVDGARLPERPVGPSRLGVNVAGTLVGLGLGFVFVMRGRSKQPL